MSCQKLFIVVFCIGLVLVNCCSLSSAQNSLAEQYAPILFFEQNEECYPVDVSYHIENAILYELNNPSPIETTVTPEVLAQYTSDKYYLDNQKGTVHDDGIIRDYQSQLTHRGCTVYTKVDANVIQYWFFYAFNKGDMNQHEGDWEMVQISFSDGVPTEVMYSQHHSGQKATWEQVEREGDHIKVYVARGSHANYLRPYSGKLGLASDSVGNNGKILRLGSGYVLEELTVQPWLSFGGYWGWVGETKESGIQSMLLGQAGPQGPKYRENGDMWRGSSAWSSTLMPVHDVLFIGEWILYYFPGIFALVTLSSILVLCYKILRRHKKYGLGPRKIAVLYIDGVNLKSIGNILCIGGLSLACVGLVLPWYSVSTNISIAGYQPIELTKMIAIDGIRGIQITLPNQNGPTPLGAFSLPFSLFIAIGILLMILSTVGISQSKKLGKKYVLRGIRLLIPSIIVIPLITIIGIFMPLLAPSELQQNSAVLAAISSISTAPFGGSQTIHLNDIPGSTIGLSWGFGIGLALVCIAGCIMIAAGACEILAKESFFEQKQPELLKEKPEEK